MATAPDKCPGDRRAPHQGDSNAALEPPQPARSVGTRLRTGLASASAVLIPLGAAGRNAGWLFTDRILRLTVGLILSTWMARLLGPADYGLLGYATAVVAIAGVGAGLGIDSLVVRELTRRPAESGTILGTVLFLRAVGAAFFGALVLFFVMHSPHGAPAAILVAILSASLMLQAGGVINLSFQAQLKSRWTVYAGTTSYLVFALIRIALLLHRAPVVAFAWAALGETVLTDIVLWAGYHQEGGRFGHWSVQRATMRQLLIQGWPLALSSLAVVGYMRLDQLMLNEMLGPVAVGLYSTAARISELGYFIPMVITASFLPVLTRARTLNLHDYYTQLGGLMRRLAVVAVLIALATSVLSSVLIRLLFGAAYSGSAPVLAIHAWAGVFVFLGVVQNQWAVLEERTHLSALWTLCGLATNLALNLVLIPRFGPPGAAAATLVSYGVSTVLLNGFLRTTRPIFWLQLGAFLPLRWQRHCIDQCLR